jgi:hypothetical protein
VLKQCLLLLSLCGAAWPASAFDILERAAVMTYIYNAPESDTDQRYLYAWQILRTALDKTSPLYGPYKLKQAPVMTESRQIRELTQQSGIISVMYLDTRQELEDQLVPVRIAVDKNLMSYRVLLAREEQLPALAKVRSLDDLRHFSFGFGLGWSDVAILKHNKFNVVTGSSYDGLFHMLATKRFDLFSRGANEVLDEYAIYRQKHSNLRIEPSLLLYYPMPAYFWFSNSAQGKVLAQRVEAGMRLMQQDGSFDAIFNQFYADDLQQLQLAQRRLLKIDNPLLPANTPQGTVPWQTER